MAGYYCRDCDEVKPLFPASASATELAIPCLGSVPFDPALAALGDETSTDGSTSEHPSNQAIDSAALQISEALETDR